MLEILEMKDENILGFRADGRIEKSDVKKIFEVLEEKTVNGRKLQIYAEIEDFKMTDLSGEALKEDLKLWLKHPGILPNIEKAVLLTDSNWIRKAFDIECFLIPTLEGKSFSRGEKDLAMDWLKTDQREPERLDLTFSELAQISTFKFAGGIAVGYLTASLFGSKQRKALGTAILCGTILGGIPLGLKVLNNNRRLLKGCD